MTDLKHELIILENDPILTLSDEELDEELTERRIKILNRIQQIKDAFEKGRRYFTVSLKTNNGMVNWSVNALTEDEAKEVAKKEIIEQFEISGYIVKQIKEEQGV